MLRSWTKHRWRLLFYFLRMTCSHPLHNWRLVGDRALRFRLFMAVAVDGNQLCSALPSRVAAGSLASLAGEQDTAFAWLAALNDGIWQLSVYAWSAEGLARFVTIIDASTGKTWRAGNSAFLIGDNAEIGLIAEQWQSLERRRLATQLHLNEHDRP